MRDVFSPDATRAVMGDWVEMELILTDRRSVSDALVVRSSETIDDDLDAGQSDWDGDADERVDREILDDRLEKCRSDVWDELWLRQQALGDLYPFVLTRAGATNWKLTRREPTTVEIGIAHHVYVGALIMASVRHGHIKKQREVDPQWSTLEKKLSTHLQHLAAYAAAMLLGQAYSFGWPRPDRSSFREALVDAMRCLGLGSVRASFPLDSTGQEKDGTVDVLAWHAFKDRSYGALVLLGQVASGSNWNSKPIFTYLDEKFLRYLDPAPAKHYIGALFVPFLMHTEVLDPPHGNMEGAIRDRAIGLESTYGTVVDRLRLTELLGDGLPRADQLHNCLDPAVALKGLAEWVTSCRSYCDQAA